MTTCIHTEGCILEEDYEKLKRMEYESVMQLRDHAILLNEMLSSMGYSSGPMQELLSKINEVSSRVVNQTVGA